MTFILMVFEINSKRGPETESTGLSIGQLSMDLQRGPYSYVIWVSHKACYQE